MDRPRLTALAIPGAIHLVRGGLVCQDAIRTWQGMEGQVIAIADGHGHQRYTHSDVGARLACEVGIDAGRMALARLRGVKGPSETVLAMLEPEYCRFVAYEWNRRVKHHIAMRHRLEQGSPWPGAMDGDREIGVRADGSTLLSLVLSEHWALWFQLGTALASTSRTPARAGSSRSRRRGTARPPTAWR
ncbi:MAG TPA: protein phosphatase 2C domain-containing protein [Myxococcota bacterium]|nr:protein phosphatase 2C domain-containing protein [Myxococcota bacterium]